MRYPKPYNTVCQLFWAYKLTNGDGSVYRGQYDDTRAAKHFNENRFDPQKEPDRRDES